MRPAILQQKSASKTAQRAKLTVPPKHWLKTRRASITPANAKPPQPKHGGTQALRRACRPPAIDARPRGPADANAGATLTYDDERRDYELCKFESVPGVREDDPLDGAKVALPPQITPGTPNNYSGCTPEASSPTPRWRDDHYLGRTKMSRGTLRPSRLDPVHGLVLVR